MTTAENNKIRRVAAAVTLMVVAVAIVVILCLKLRYNPLEERRWPPEDTSELLFEGEYVMAGDVAVPEQSEPSRIPEQKMAPAQEAQDIANGGEQAPEPAPLVASERNSPMKVAPKPKPEKTGPSKEELERREQEKREREMAREINNRMKFGTTSASDAGKGTAGKSGSPNGNAASGALSGTPGTSLSGRTLESWQKPSSTASGIVKVRVKVDASGRVVDVAYSGGSGAAAASAAIRKSCVAAARNSRFSVAQDGGQMQSGTITYRFN